MNSNSPGVSACPGTPPAVVAAPRPSWLRRLWRAWLEAALRDPKSLAGLRELDPHTLRDIGLDPDPGWPPHEPGRQHERLRGLS